MLDYAKELMDRKAVVRKKLLRKLVDSKEMKDLLHDYKENAHTYRLDIINMATENVFNSMYYELNRLENLNRLETKKALDTKNVNITSLLTSEGYSMYLPSIQRYSFIVLDELFNAYSNYVIEPLVNKYFLGATPRIETDMKLTDAMTLLGVYEFIYSYCYTDVESIRLNNDIVSKLMNLNSEDFVKKSLTIKVLRKEEIEKVGVIKLSHFSKIRTLALEGLLTDNEGVNLEDILWNNYNYRLPMRVVVDYIYQNGRKIDKELLKKLLG